MKLFHLFPLLFSTCSPSDCLKAFFLSSPNLSVIYILAAPKTVLEQFIWLRYRILSVLDLVALANDIYFLRVFDCPSQGQILFEGLHICL